MLPSILANNWLQISHRKQPLHANMRPCLILLILLVTPIAITQGLSPCVPGLKALLTEDPRAPMPSHSTLTGQIIIPAYNFTCYGAITGWEVVVTGKTLSTIHFQVWQWVAALNTYRLVGENVIKPLDGIEGLAFSGKRLQLSITSSREQILVSPDDFIGIFIGNEGTIKLQHIMSQNTIVYISNFPDLKSFVKPLILDPAFVETRMAAPQISITMRSILMPSTTVEVNDKPSSTTWAVSGTTMLMPTKTPDTEGNTAMQDITLPYSLITGASVSAAIIIGVFIVVLIVIACFMRKRSKLRSTQNPAEATNDTSKVTTLLCCSDRSRRNLMIAFKRQKNVQSEKYKETRSNHHLMRNDLGQRNPNLSQSNLELSYAYPTTERPIHLVRSVSSTLPRKLGSHVNIPLPEIPKEFVLRENPSYSALNSLESLNQPDQGHSVTDNIENNIYDQPVFRPSHASLPVSEYEIPLSSLNSSGGIPTKGSHVYETTENI